MTTPNGVAEPPGAAVRDRSSVPPLFLLWAAIVAGLSVFLALGMVRVGAGGWIGRRMSVRQVWARFLEYLADLGAPPIVVLLVAVAAAIILVGAGYVLWLAFNLRDAPGDAGADEAP